MITQNLANTMYGSTDAAVGQVIKLSGLPFVVVGTFRERVDTFGQSEISDDTILIPYTVARFFTTTDTVKQLFFSVADSSDIPGATEQIQKVLQSRHRPESVYKVDNLTQLLTVAGKIANALTTILLLIAVLTLLVSGVGIMNIMLATVNSRIREIGVRKAVGATNAEIRGAVPDRGCPDLADRRTRGHCDRHGAAHFRACADQLPHSDLRLVDHHRRAGVVADWSDVRHHARCARRATRSGGESAVRMNSGRG